MNDRLHFFLKGMKGLLLVPFILPCLFGYSLLSLWEDMRNDFRCR